MRNHPFLSIFLSGILSCFFVQVSYGQRPDDARMSSIEVSRHQVLLAAEQESKPRIEALEQILNARFQKFFQEENTNQPAEDLLRAVPIAVDNSEARFTHVLRGTEAEFTPDDGRMEKAVMEAQDGIWEALRDLDGLADVVRSILLQTEPADRIVKLGRVTLRAGGELVVRVTLLEGDKFFPLQGSDIYCDAIVDEWEKPSSAEVSKEASVPETQFERLTQKPLPLRLGPQH